MDEEVIARFTQTLRGPVIGRNHPEYQEARKLYNAMIDKSPLLIARCADAGDVIAAVKFGRDSKLPIAIRGGGHNGPGLASVDDGLVIDLSMMKGVRVDPKQNTVRVGPGCTTGDVDHATHAFGQAVPFGIVFVDLDRPRGPGPNNVRTRAAEPRSCFSRSSVRPDDSRDHGAFSSSAPQLQLIGPSFSPLIAPPTLTLLWLIYCFLLDNSKVSKEVRYI